MKTNILLTFFLFMSLIPFTGFCQEPDNLDILLALYRENENNDKKIEELLKNDPALQERLEGFINSEMELPRPDLNTTPEQAQLMTESAFKMQIEVLKGILSNENIGGLEAMYWTIIESEYSKELGDILLSHMQRSREKLERSIEQNLKRN